MHLPMTMEEWGHKAALVDTKAANYILVEASKRGNPLYQYGGIVGMFAWVDTPQGFKYWSDVRDKVGELP